jgi:hypothetical protein
MSSISILGDTSGSVLLQAPAVAGSTTITMPAATGTMMVSGNIPAFSAYRSGSDQSFSATTWTKLQFNNEYLDTASCYDTSNNRFTPNVAGYYLFTLTPLIGASSSLTEIYIQFYKNGAGINQYALCSLTSGVFNTFTPSVQTIVYMNGTTDYMEAYAYVGGTSPRFNAGGGVFTGVLVRGA